MPLAKDLDTLRRHPEPGPSWEGFALEAIIGRHRADPEESWFWSTYSGAEIDLLIVTEGKRLGYEIKYSDHPKLTQSMRSAGETLGLDSLTVIYPGNRSFPLADSVTATGLEYLFSD